MTSQVEQIRNRVTDEIPSVDEFVVLRRRTIGGQMVEGERLAPTLPAWFCVQVNASDFRS